jgi:hypothetical protein
MGEFVFGQTLQSQDGGRKKEREKNLIMEI